MKLTPLRCLFLVAAAVCWAPIQASQAALLVYEPFDYTSVTGSDQDGDGNKDLMGLSGGSGWSGAWTELTNSTSIAQGTNPLDYVNSLNLSHPSGDPRFSNAGPGSLHIQNFATGKTSQSSSVLQRDFTESLLLSEGTTIWLSVLLRKDSEQPDPTTGQTRTADSFEIGLVQADFDGIGGSIPPGLFMGDVVGTISQGETSTFFGLEARSSPQEFAFLDGRGPRIGETNFLVMKLSVTSGIGRMDFFLNPSLDEMSPVPDLSLVLGSAAYVDKLYTGLEMRMSPSRPEWTVDEIRVGETYTDVVPEPSSLLLTGIGAMMIGGARLRRSRVSRN